jgi:hypothetical protein
MTPTIISQQRRSARQASVSAPPSIMDQPSLDEWIIGQLQERGFHPLEQLASPLRPVNWSELFLAIDRLTRMGKIFLWPATSGDIVLSLNSKDTPPGAVFSSQLAASSKS